MSAQHTLLHGPQMHTQLCASHQHSLQRLLPSALPRRRRSGSATITAAASLCRERALPQRYFVQGRNVQRSLGMHSNLPSAQSDESNTGDDEPIRIPPESEDLWAQLPEIDTEDDDINAYVPPWLKNLTEEQKAERAMVEDLSRQKTEVKRRRVAPTFENQEQDQEYKPRYNKYRTVEDKARNRLNKWEMIFARGRWGSGKRPTTAYILSYIPLKIWWHVFDSRVRFLCWHLTKPFRRFRQKWHRGAVMWGARFDSLLARIGKGEPEHTFSRSMVLKRYHRDVPLWRSVLFRIKLLLGKPNPRPIRVSAEFAATHEAPIELMPEEELEFMSYLY
mmetsp:Transcript_4928/g.14195  ORF Transcript_4928/g.14195 Transcript_4928/m.14195 type:complete len:334 (+) Transcript_4928:326-1327(+)